MISFVVGIACEGPSLTGMDELSLVRLVGPAASSPALCMQIRNPRIRCILRLTAGRFDPDYPKHLIVVTKKRCPRKLPGQKLRSLLQFWPLIGIGRYCRGDIGQNPIKCSGHNSHTLRSYDQTTNKLHEY